MSVLAEEPTFESSQVHHFPGQYDFTISLGSMNEENADHIPRNVVYTFSSKLNRFYVKKEAICPFAIFTSGIPPSYCKIKIIVYSKDNVPVMRCHAHTGDLSEFVSPLHYMRSENPLALYECCKKTGELSIKLPFSKPQDVAEGIENLRFLCFSKYCIKKELFIKFSLMDSAGKVLGYHEFGLHVCSTPGRDRLSHEEGKVKLKRKRKMLAGSSCTQRSEVPGLQQSDEVFKIPVKDRMVYEWLALINRGLELIDAIPFDIQEKYLKKYHARPSSTASSATRTSADTAASSSSDTRYTLRPNWRTNIAYDLCSKEFVRPSVKSVMFKNAGRLEEHAQITQAK